MRCRKHLGGIDREGRADAATVHKKATNAIELAIQDVVVRGVRKIVVDGDGEGGRNSQKNQPKGHDAQLHKMTIPTARAEALRGKS